MIWKYRTPGIPDEKFVQRDDVPGPTKEEIRVLTVSKSRLKDGSLVADIGCGTGGLTVEAAIQIAPKGKIFAIDHKPEAVELTKINVAQFCLQNNVEVILGKATEVMTNLPLLDAIIIGGTQSLKQILNLANKKLKENGRLVVNSILIETYATTLSEIKCLDFIDIEVTEVFVAKGKTTKIGTMMLGRNPIKIISATKGTK